MSWPELLYGTLTRRAMPETVAAVIVADPDAAGEFTPEEMRLLRRAAGARGPVSSLSSMPEDFTRHPGCGKAIAVALEVHGAGAWPGDPSDLAAIAGLIDQLGAGLGGWRHGSDWKSGRLDRAARAAVAAAAPAGTYPWLEGGHRLYSKRVRVLRNLWEHAVAMDAAGRFRRLLMVSRSGFACDITRSRFLGDRAAAAFIAYLTARKNLRREFSLAGRDNPVDVVAAMLLARCERAPATDWAMIADVWPRPDVLRHLDDGQLGNLLGRWWTVMRDCSAELARLWSAMSAAQAAWADARGHGYDPDSHQHGRPCTWCGRGPDAALHGLPREINRAEMIVRAGMDSDGWNTTAAAYNAARAAWIGCAVASGAGALLVPFLPGKVMRVMAADLAWWHQASGGHVHPDQAVWDILPLPWDVIAGLEDCTMSQVNAACTAAGLDAAASGWTAPLLPGQAAAFRPTPELVHGVAVADPAWAMLLRKAGVFSGRTASADQAVAAALLRAEAQAQGMITGELPVYGQAGGYAGSAGAPG